MRLTCIDHCFFLTKLVHEATGTAGDCTSIRTNPPPLLPASSPPYTDINALATIMSRRGSELQHLVRPEVLDGLRQALQQLCDKGLLLRGVQHDELALALVADLEQRLDRHILRRSANLAQTARCLLCGSSTADGCWGTVPCKLESNWPDA